jgi:anti-sigma factor RsiW
MDTTMKCAEAREHFPAFDIEKFPAEVLGHLEHCEHCRTELAEYRELQANLGTLASMDIQPPAWLLGTVTERVMETARRRAALLETRRQLERYTTKPIGEHRVAAGSALGLAVLAGALLFGRTRKGHRPAGAKAAA